MGKRKSNEQVSREFDQVKLSDCTLSQFANALIRGNGFGHESLWIKEFFGEKQFGIVEETVGQYEHNISQYVMKDFFEATLGFSKVQETYYDEGGEVAVTYENLECDLGKFVKIYKNAFVMYERGNEHLCVSVNKYSPREIIYRIYSPLGMDTVLVDWLKYARKHNMYNGKKIDADLTFLQLENVTWEDIILQQKTVDIVRSHVDELFIYREYLIANNMSLKRGVILAGPPGCVLGDTKIKVRKISQEGKHEIYRE